jgi:hypothetical protein
MSEEKVKAVEVEVQRLQDAKVIREVKYPVWLANTKSFCKTTLLEFDCISHGQTA